MPGKCDAEAHERSRIIRNFAERELTITRVFDAPRALVFKAWTDRSIWRNGGVRRASPIRCGVRCSRRRCAAYPHERAGWQRLSDEGCYPGDRRAERLVFTNIAIDASGKHLLEGLTTVIFSDERGKTKMTLHTKVVAVTEVAIAYLQGMEMGWTQSIDKLEAFVARVPDPLPSSRVRA